MTADEWTAVIIEDDPDVRDLIDIVLTQSGFRTVLAEDGPSGIEAVRQHDPLITTLDVNMPGMDGFAAAKRLREFSNTYLIMITALADEIDVVQGFEAGADDYLVKPFRPRELRARADSMLRRPRERVDQPTGPSAPVEPAPAREPDSWAAQAARDLQEQALPPRSVSALPPARAPIPEAAPAAEPVPVPAHLHAVAPPPHVDHGGAAADGSWVRFNGLALNNETRSVTVGGAGVELTRTEFDLLASLLSTGRRVRSKADLVLTMRGQQYVTSYFVNEADKRSVEVHIANLRRKIGDDSANPRYVETVRGVGYRLADPL
ncbi:Transcriptional regulatory protein SrrA [Nocardioides dokdonensis FR1436]|uniref:Transcriptional regulatory protein SrrA n=1 Tax=Nocardioides dokdonensis FR1436 TaxID=1300347 RepID=A0A1A9GG18_9ACTN|nr:response regulator transcription factor [Nocardioides dokdonensis]ANH36640.1 Transcriptional regulatory protein SrrA [Nocardioides dokdonensis FR1436]